MHYYQIYLFILHFVLVLNHPVHYILCTLLGIMVALSQTWCPVLPFGYHISLFWVTQVLMNYINYVSIVDCGTATEIAFIIYYDKYDVIWLLLEIFIGEFHYVQHFFFGGVIGVQFKREGGTVGGSYFLLYIYTVYFYHLCLHSYIPTRRYCITFLNFKLLPISGKNI